MAQKNEKKRVAVTGMGVISPVGIGTKAMWRSLVEGKNGVGPVSLFDPDEHDVDVKIGCEVKNFDPTDYVTKKEANRMDRCSQFTTAASLMAFENAKLTMKKIDSTRVGIILGTAIGAVKTWEDSIDKLYKHGHKKISPATLPMSIMGIVSGQIAMLIGAHGKNQVVSTACSSGTQAIGNAYLSIKNDEADVILAGGAEAPITPWGYKFFQPIKAMSTNNTSVASCPFSKHRSGFVMGEGTGILVLESFEHAEKRGADILAEVVGFGATADAYHITAPHPEGDFSSRAMEIAIQMAGIAKEKVGHINSHGTSTKYNDLHETKAIKKVFGKHAYDLKINSTKSMMGHAQGAGGGLEAIATIMALHEGIIPPTINFQEYDPELDLDYSPNKAIPTKTNYAISNSFGFGGNNASLILKKIS